MMKNNDTDFCRFKGTVYTKASLQALGVSLPLQRGFEDIIKNQDYEEESVYKFIDCRNIITKITRKKRIVREVKKLMEYKISKDQEKRLKQLKQ